MTAAAPGERWQWLLRAGFWIIPPLAAVWFHWLAVQTWFVADDFAWLLHSTEFYNFRELIHAIFVPMAQGTIRPWSDRLFFIVFYHVFGLDALPFHIFVLLTQCVNILLLLAVTRRLTGSRLAGFAAALLWTVNTSQPMALSWTSACNEPLCALFILGAFHYLLLYLETGKGRYWKLQWVIFLLGFGALELNVVYPALAASYTFLCARGHFKKTLPLFVPSIVFAVVHRLAAPAAGGVYVLHYGAPMFKTLVTYWTWAMGPGFLATIIPLPSWQVTGSILLLTLALAGMTAWRAWTGDRLPLFFLGWFLLLIAPVLPLSDHRTEYYTFLPTIGLAMAGGWGVALAWRSGIGWKLAAAVLVAIYAGFSANAATRSERWEYERSQNVRRLIEGVERAHELHPDKVILVENVDDLLFWSGVVDGPFSLLGAHHVYLTPGSEKQITAHPDLGSVREFIIPPGLAWKALMKEMAVVYRFEPQRFRNITTIYTHMVPDAWQSLKPSRMDLSNPAAGYLLGPEWYAIEGNHRWMSQRGTLQMAAPRRTGAKLRLVGGTSAASTQVMVTVDGVRLPERKISPNAAFDVTWPLPDSAAGKPGLEIVLETDHTFFTPVDGRQLGLVFGVIEIVEPEP